MQTDGDVAGWRDVFSRLGVRDGLILRKERRTFSAQELVSSHLIAAPTAQKIKGPGRVV